MCSSILSIYTTAPSLRGREWEPHSDHKLALSYTCNWRISGAVQFSAAAQFRDQSVHQSRVWYWQWQIIHYNGPATTAASLSCPYYIQRTARTTGGDSTVELFILSLSCLGERWKHRQTDRQTDRWMALRVLARVLVVVLRGTECVLCCIRCGAAVAMAPLVCPCVTPPSPYRSPMKVVVQWLMIPIPHSPPPLLVR